MPAPSQMRQLDENFVKHLEQEMKKLPEGNYEMVFALCTSRISKEQFDINNVSSYTFEVIGGHIIQLQPKGCMFRSKRMFTSKGGDVEFMLD